MCFDLVDSVANSTDTELFCHIAALCFCGPDHHIDNKEGFRVG